MGQRSPYNDRYKVEQKGKTRKSASAAKPKRASIDAARSFIRSLAPESIVPQPALHADGNTILFFRADDAYVELEFVDQKIEFYARRGETEWADELQPGGLLPVALSEIGFSI